MKILDLALKDLSQIVRDRRSLLFLVIMPIAFTVFMGFAYPSGGDGAPADTRLGLALVDPQPEEALNAYLTGRLAGLDGLRLEVLDETAARAAFQAGEVAGVLLIPPDFSAAALAGELAQLTLLADSTSTAGQSIYQLLRLPVGQLFSAVQIARMSAANLDEPAELEPALDLAWSKWQSGTLAEAVRVELAVAPEADDWTGGNPYNQASPGILVQFAIFGLVSSAQILVTERKLRTLQRLVSTSMQPWQIVAGHLLAMFLLVFLQAALLVIFGQFILGVNYLRQPVGVLLVCTSLSLWVAALGLLIGVLAREDSQVILFSMIAMFLFSALGGTWFPLEASGGAFAAIGRLMPSAWAMTGLQNILIRGLALDSAWLPSGILLAYALGFFVLAVWRFRKLEL